MSVGHLCKTCGEGRVRPFQFSLDQAVVRCDNADCDSYLENPPWDYVIRQTITPHKKRQSVFSGNQHYRAWSCSSSGALSDFRSPVESLGEPCNSRTGRSHNLLPKENKCSKSISTDASHTPETEEECWNTGSSETFFNLLCDLDLESALPKTRNEATSVPPQGNSLDLDVVTADLESWMETFDCNTSISNDKPSCKDGSLSKEPEQTLISEQESFISQTLSELFFENQSGNSDCFDGQNSKICVSDTSLNDRSSHVKEDRALCDKQFMSPAASAASDDSGYDDEANKIKSVVLPAVEKESFEYLLREHLETPKDKAVRSIHSSMSYNFEDLLCEENKGPAPPDVLNFNVHPVMVTVEKCGNVDEVEPQRGTDTNSSVVRSQDTESDKPSRDITTELHENLNCFKATSIKDCGTSASDSGFSEKECHTVQPVPGSLSSIVEIKVEANADQPSVNTFESENISSDISSQNITVLTTDAVEDVSENCTSELTTDGLSTNFDNSNEQHHVRGKRSRGKHRGRGRGRRRGRCRVTDRSQETHRSDETERELSEDKDEDNIALMSSSSEARGKGNHRGQGRGTRKPKVFLKVVPRQTRQRTGTIEVQAPRTIKRQSDDISSDNLSSSGLRSGLSSLLQGANQHIYEDRRKDSHNITNLSFRSLLKGPVAEDPWSVPEWHLEGLDIEVIVQGVRPKSRKSESRENPETEDGKGTEDRADKSDDDCDKNVEEETDMGNGKPCSSVSASRTGTLGDAEENQVLSEKMQGVSVPDDSRNVFHKGDSAIEFRNQSEYSSEETQRTEAALKNNNTSCPTSLVNHSLEGSSVNDSVEMKDPRSLGEDYESKRDSCQSHTTTESSISSSQSENLNVCTSLQKLNPNIIPKVNLNVSDDLKKDLVFLSVQKECKTHSEKKIENQASDISNTVLVVETSLSKNCEVKSGANKDNSDILSNDKEEGYSSVFLCSETPTTSVDVSIDTNESVRKVESWNTTNHLPKLRDTVKEKNEEAPGITEAICKRTDTCDIYVTDNAENNDRKIDACSDKFEYLENLLRSFESNVQGLEVTEINESKKYDEKVASDFPKTKELHSTIFMENSVGSTNSKSKLQSHEAQEVPNSENLDCGVPEHQNITHVKAVASPLNELEDDDRVLVSEGSEKPNSSPPSVENSPNSSPHYFMVFPDHVEVRTWMGFKKAVDSDGQLLKNDAETSNTEATENSEDLKSSSKELPSTYFNTLLKDLNFDETFFHCPVKEQPESTFVEHLSSSLFFGETADTSPVHPVQGTSCHSKRPGDSTNKSCSEKEFEMNSKSGDKSKDSQNIAEIKQSVTCLLANNNAITKQSVAETMAVVLPYTNNAYTKHSVSEAVTVVPPFADNAATKQSVSETRAVVLPYTNNVNTKQSMSKTMAISILCKNNVNCKQSVSETLAVSPLLTSSNRTSSKKPNVGEGCSKLINEDLCIFEGGREVNKSKIKADFSDGIVKLPSKLESDNILLNPNTKSSNKNKLFDIVQHSSASSLSANSMKGSTFSEKLGAMGNSKPKEVSKKRKLSDSELEDTKRFVKSTKHASLEGVHSSGKKDFLTVTEAGQSETLGKVCLENNLVINVKEECINEDDEEMPIVSLDDDDIQIIVPEKKCKVEEDDISLQCDTIKKENEVRDLSSDIDLDYAAQIKEAEQKIRAGTLPIKGSLSSNNCDMLPEKRDFYSKEFSKPVEDNFLTCGILDNSIPHDKKCYSPRMKVFVDFEDSFEGGEPPSSLKVYYGTRKRKYEICKDLNIDFDLSESAHINSDELTASVFSPSHVSRTDTFTYNPGFGCTKFSPQHDETDSVKDERVSDLGVQDFDDFPSFLSDSSLSENSISPSNSNSMEYFGNVKSTGDDWESSGVEGGKGDESNPENADSKRDIMYQAHLGPKAETSESGWPEGESSGSCEFHMQNNPQLESISSESSLTLSSSSRQLNRTFPIHTLTQAPETKQENRCDVDTPTEKQLKRDARVLILPRNNSCNIPIVPAVPIKKAVSNHLPIPMLGISTSSPGTSPYHSSNPSTTSVALNSFTHSRLGQKICSKNTVLTQVGHVNQALRPPLHHTPMQAPGNLVDSEPGTLPASQVFDCTNNSSILGSYVLGTEHRNPNIDYKIPQQCTRPIIVPPALASSYKNDFLQEREISGAPYQAVSNRQPSERIIAVTRQTSDGPVTRLLRVSTLAERGSDALQDKSIVGERSGSEMIDEKPSAATHCNSEEKKVDLLQNNMIKKVKMGSKGSFYLRPSPALMNAIAELRSKGNLPAGNKSKLDRSESDVIELPDGRPISPPIHIQPKVLLKKKRRRRGQMDIRERQIKRLAKEKVQETVERRKIEEDIPEMVAVCLGGKLHIYHRKDVH